MAETVSQLLEIEYDELYSNNVFKKSSQRKTDYFAWRMGQIDDARLAAKYGCSPQTFANKRRRMEDNDVWQIPGLDKAKHIQQVAATHDKIKSANDLKKQPILSKKEKSEGVEYTGYSLQEHIEQELMAIGADPEISDWTEILLYVSKYLFINELSVYRELTNRGKNTRDPAVIKALLDIADKKSGRLRNMISDYISEWGTLHHGTAAESITEQEAMIEQLADMVMELNPDKMADVTSLLDGNKKIPLDDE